MQTRQVIFEALKNIFTSALTVHTIDSNNSAMELDYDMIADEIIFQLNENGYSIVESKNNV
jgi:hypothetical protein